MRCLGLLMAPSTSGYAVRLRIPSRRSLACSSSPTVESIVDRLPDLGRTDEPLQLPLRIQMIDHLPQRVVPVVLGPSAAVARVARDLIEGM
jgi:hypothetical protein